MLQGYKYFGFDPETLCHIKVDPDNDNDIATQSGDSEPIALIKQGENHATSFQPQPSTHH